MKKKPFKTWQAIKLLSHIFTKLAKVGCICWALETEINLLQLNSLVKGLSNIFSAINLPKDGRTNLNTYSKRGKNKKYENC